MPTMQQVPADHPLMIAWNKYRATKEAKATEVWARRLLFEPIEEGGKLTQPYLEGSLWEVFMAGFNAATERSASLHESVNPASDDERLNKVPGAGAMGAVIEYRDLIRATL